MRAASLPSNQPSAPSPGSCPVRSDSPYSLSTPAHLSPVLAGRFHDAELASEGRSSPFPTSLSSSFPPNSLHSPPTSLLGTEHPRTVPRLNPPPCRFLPPRTSSSSFFLPHSLHPSFHHPLQALQPTRPLARRRSVPRAVDRDGGEEEEGKSDGGENCGRP